MVTASPASYAEYWPVNAWLAATPIEQAMAATVAPRTEAVFAHINQARWIVQCPDCNGAQLACLADHRFMCNECANIAIGGLWRPVIWPAEVKDISAVIGARTDRELQNYEPGETVAQLREQNAVLASGGDAARYIPGADTEEEVPGAASDHEGHAHRWPTQVKADGVYTCADSCGLEVTGLLLINDRKASA